MSEKISLEEWNALRQGSEDNSGWDSLKEVKMRSPNAGDPWTGYSSVEGGIEKNEPDIEGVPQTIFRGEKVYLGNIDEVGKRSLTTKGHERTNNRDGKVFLARDKMLAETYAIGKDGVQFYDNPLSVEEIPIGVVYKIDNHDNQLGATPTSNEPESFGPFEGKFREFIADEVPVDAYTVEEILIMDDFEANDGPQYLSPDSPYKTFGHVRSDFRSPLEVYKIKSQEELPSVIEKVKKRMYELDERRKKSPN